jgi:hypothetical protein
MQETLTMNDGTILAGHAFESDGRLYAYLDDSTMSDAFTIMNDPQKTIRIAANRYGEIAVYEGYNRLRSISLEDNNTISVVLKKV